MGIAVLNKTFSVLEILARSGGGLSLAELREEIRLPKPTVYRILLTLRELRYVEQTDPRGTYSLSPRLSSLRTCGRDRELRARALPWMEELRAEFDETVNLGVLEGAFVRYVAVVETSQALRWIVEPGARDRFETTALGRAIAAGLSSRARQQLVALTLPEAKALREKARSALAVKLAATARRGYALDEEETVAGVACVAVGLGGCGAVDAALSVSVPITRFQPAKKQALIVALRQIREKSFHNVKRS